MPRALSELFALVEAHLKVRYRQTFIGFFWVLANPILLFGVQMFLFGRLLPNVGSSYYLYLFSGLLPWFYLTQTAEMACAHLSVNAPIMRNLDIHPYKIIWSLAVENYINFLCYSLLIFTYLSFVHSIGWLNFLMYLFFSLFLVVFTAHLSFMAALLNVLLRDTRYILHFVFTIFYFLTPTFYLIDHVPGDLQNIIRLNPFYWIITLFRIPQTSENILYVLGLNAVLSLAAGAGAFLIWRKFKSDIYLKL